MPAIRINGRDYEELAIRQIRDPVTTNITSLALPPNAATETTLAQVRDAIKATIDLESTIWTDNSGAYYVRRDTVNEGTGAITISWTAPDGTAATPGAGLKPLATAERDVTQALFVATDNGTGYSTNDFLARLLILDVNATTPVITQIWYNLSTSAVIAAPSAAHVTPSDESVVVASSALPAGASTSAKQDTLIGHVDGIEGLLTTIDVDTGNIDGKLPSGLTVSSTRLLVDGSGVTQPVSATSLPLPTGAATSANQSTANTSLSNLDADVGAQADAAASSDTGTFSLIALIKRGLQNWTTLLGRIPSNLTVSSTRLLVDGSGVTQPISASSLPLPTGAASAANQTTANTSLSNIDTKVPSGLTVTSTRLLVDGSGVTQPTSVAVRTPTTTSVASSASSVTILALNANRRGLSIANVSTATLSLSFSTPATAANCFAQIPANGFLLLDQQLIVTNAIYGIWSSANGTAQVTEYV